jgi:murein DD-endopeptidase MepM/ murein hydrolase activator NlpD
VIALSGNTGRSTAPHLHFEILQDGSPIDPFTLVQQRTGS